MSQWDSVEMEVCSPSFKAKKKKKKKHIKQNQFCNIFNTDIKNGPCQKNILRKFTEVIVHEYLHA